MLMLIPSSEQKPEKRIKIKAEGNMMVNGYRKEKIIDDIIESGNTQAIISNLSNLSHTESKIHVVFGKTKV